MPHEALDDLLGIAEIGTVFIGFAVLISVVSRKPSNQHQVLGMVIGAAMVLMACILPLVIRTLDLPISTVVRISSAAFMVINIAGTLAMFRYIPGFAESQRTASAGLIWSIEAAMYVLLALCALGLWPAYAVTLYYAAVVLLLFQVIVLFIALAIGLSRDDAD